MICVDPVSAAIEAAGVTIWLLCSWLVFQIVAEGIDRLEQLSLTDLITRLAERFWRRFA